MDKEIFIIGAGSSFQGFDFSKLKDKETIAVNKSIKDVPNPTYFFTADSGIASNVVEWTEGIDTIKVLAYSVTHKRFEKFEKAFPNFDFIIKYGSGNPKPDIGFRFGEFQPGQNSGFSALQFAVIMGYTPIYLLGFDLTSDKQGRIHRHDTKSQSFQFTLNEFYDYFKKGLEILKTTDIKVYSCFPISRLNKIIPFLDIDYVLRLEGDAP